MLAEEKNRIRERFNGIVRELDLPDLDTEVIETDSIKVAGIGVGLTMHGKLRYKLFLGPMFRHYDEEKCLGHEAGHLKFRNEHPKIYKLLSLLQKPTRPTIKLLKYEEVLQTVYILSLGPLVVMSLKYLYVAPVAALLTLTIIAPYADEYLAGRSARKYGVPAFGL